MNNPEVLAAVGFISLLAGALQLQRAARLGGAAFERWWMITAAIVIVMLFFALFTGPQFGFIGYPMAIVVVPLLTVVLVIHSPVPWGCAAGAVTLLHGAAWICSIIAGVKYAAGDLDTLAKAYVLNAVLVAGVAVARASRRAN